jgi:hypothetical protein
VTAIKDGVRNVYSAFINGEGVPSIVLMHGEDSTEPNGVEVKFAVDSRGDFYKFAEEARHVYTYFALRPVVSGGDDHFAFRDVEYKEKNIIPGVHYTEGRSSRAVMGNIAYPIDIPNAESALGELSKLLDCGLEMHFDIGELDFQASREGLSYITQTINAIRFKLEALNAQLAVHVALEADVIDNDWNKTYFLQKKSGETLFKSAAVKYAQDTKFDLIDATNSYYMRGVPFKHDVKDLASKYNIEVLAFQKGRHGGSCSELKPGKVYQPAPSAEIDQVWEFSIEPSTIIVVNDTRVGASSRAKYHWRNAEAKGIKLPGAGYSTNVYVLSPAVKGKVMDTIGFFAELRQPPATQRMMASELMEKERKTGTAGMGANVSIMSLQRRGYGGYHKERELVWKDAGKVDSFDNANETYYYLPLKGFVVETEDVPIQNMRHFSDMVTESGVPGLQGITIHGVRKTDIEYIKTQTNWINVQDHIRAVLAKLDPKIVQQCALKQIDANKYFRYNKDIAKLVSPNSAYSKFLTQFKFVDNVKVDKHSLERLCRDYATPVDVDSVVQGLTDQLTAIRNRYPLLSSLRDYDINADAVAQYINLIDKEA